VDPPAREFERQLDVLSGEYPVLRDDAEPPGGRSGYDESGAAGGDPGDEMQPPEQGRRRA
jgi:hypothetical protein